MLLSSSRLVPSVPRALKNTPIPFLSRFKSSSASTASKSLAPPSKSPHPIFQSYRSPTLVVRTNTNYQRFSSTTSDALNDDEFNRLPPLEQTRFALTKAPQTTLPRIECNLLDIALDCDISGQAREPPSFGLPKMSLMKLAYLGDRVWDQAVLEVLFSIGVGRMKDVKPESAWELSLYKGLLVTNDLALVLARSTGLLERYGRSNASVETGSAIWEAYLAVLFLEQGKRSLLEFLAPIVKAELLKRLDMLRREVKRQTAKRLEISEEAKRLAKSEKEVSKRENEIKRIRLLPKLDPIPWSCLDFAHVNFRTMLDDRKIPFHLNISPSKHSATLQLPGTCLLAVKVGARCTNKESTLLFKLAREAAAKGFFTIDASKTEARIALSSPKSALSQVSAKAISTITPLIKKPLTFTSIDLAYKGFLPGLQARKVRFVHKAPRSNRQTLALPGLPLIISDATTKAEHRRALVERALSLGIVKLKSSASSTKSVPSS